MFTFCVVNLDLGKFGPHPALGAGLEEVYPSMWEVCKAQNVEKFHFT